MTYGERLQEADRLTKENQELLSTPLMSEGSISPMQIGLFSARQKARWQKNTMAKMDLDYKIKRLRRTDKEIAIEEKRIQDRREKERQATMAILNSKVDFIHGLGIMSHKRNGGLKRPYQITVDGYREEINKLAI